MKDPRINTSYDFEGDEEDIEDNERWLRRLHPVEECPLLDGEDCMDDREDRVHYRSRNWWLQKLEKGE